MDLTAVVFMFAYEIWLLFSHLKSDNSFCVAILKKYVHKQQQLKANWVARLET